jgi:hypothetical protein
MNNESKFIRNFNKAIAALTNCDENEHSKFDFLLNPINEEIGKSSSKDHWMINAVLKNNGIEELQSYSNSIRILSAGRSHYPLWIKISQKDTDVLQLEFSTRFRHIKNCHNQETDFPPFEVVV